MNLDLGKTATQAYPHYLQQKDSVEAGVDGEVLVLQAGPHTLPTSLHQQSLLREFQLKHCLAYLFAPVLNHKHVEPPEY